MKLSKSFRVLFVVLATSGAAAAGADPTPPQIAIGRVRLECLLHDREQARAAILDEQRRAQALLAHTEAFRGRLDPTTNAAAIGVAEQAILRERNALVRIAQRLAMLDQAIATAHRAIANLVPAPAPPSLFEQAKRAGNISLANAMHCGEAPGETSPVGDLSLVARLFAADFCGLRNDAAFESRGLSRNPVLIDRLDRIIARLNAVSPNTAIRLLAGCQSEGGGAFATSTTSYISECLLGPSHSDDEIAFLLAHERAHVTMQHLSLTYIAQALERRGVAGLTANPDVITAALAANMGAFGRAQENEADLTGAITALSAGFSPRGIREFLTNLGADPTTRRGAELILERMSADHSSANERRLALQTVFGADFLDADPASGKCPPASR